MTGLLRHALPVSLAVALAGCGQAPEEEHSGTEAPAGAASPVETPAVATSASGDVVAAVPLAEDLVRNEWRTAANKDQCAPLVLTSDGGVPGEARRANFGGGWGVAFDTDSARSAYGVAGPGLTDADKADGQEARLRGQWPYFMALPDLPAPAFAGYGLEGARAYAADLPEGVGENSLAYVRVAGQDCTYNVWSRLGRAHLEALLNSLRTGAKD